MPGLLIADDMPIIRRTVAKIAAREEPELQPVVEASNGVEALTLARRIQPDIIFMDIKMPILDGLKAASMIRAEQPAIKIIILTAHDEFSYAQQALRLGAIDYLLKPIRPRNLREVLTKIHAEVRREQHQKHRLETVTAHLRNRDAEDTLQAAPPVEPDLVNENLSTQVREALTYIRENLHRSDITLKQVASKVNLSQSHLAYLIKSNLGMSYIAYLTTLRIEQAKKLLRSTDLSIAAIAEMVGYATASNFYRLFRKETNMTPAAYRKSIQTPVAR